MRARPLPARPGMVDSASTRRRTDSSSTDRPSPSGVADGEKRRPLNGVTRRRARAAAGVSEPRHRLQRLPQPARRAETLGQVAQRLDRVAVAVDRMPERHQAARFGEQQEQQAVDDGQRLFVGAVQPRSVPARSAAGPAEGGRAARGLPGARRAAATGRRRPCGATRRAPPGRSAAARQSSRDAAGPTSARNDVSSSRTHSRSNSRNARASARRASTRRSDRPLVQKHQGSPEATTSGTAWRQAASSGCPQAAVTRTGDR